MKFKFYIHLVTTASLVIICQFAYAQTGNYFSGTAAGASNTTGDYNAFAGYGAGTNNTSGSLNTAFGFYAGASNQATSYNTSIGAYAGYFTSSSFGENVFVGYRSGFYNSNGFYNVFLGSNAGYTNNSGSYNVFIGSGVGYDNTSGLSNTFIGYASGANNTTASANTFVGNLSGFSNTTGANNAFYGSGCGTSNTTGALNVFVGSGSGYYNSTGGSNAFFGYYAGRNSTASNNTFLGRGAGEKTTTGGVNTFVGSEAGSNNVNGYNNVFMGRTAGQGNTSGFENTFVGRSAGIKNTSGKNNAAFGYMAGPSVGTLTNATAIGNKAYVTASNSLVLGSINGVNGATADTKVGIRTTAPGYTLHVNGTAAKPGGGSWTAASDKRLKQNVQDFKQGVEILSKIKPVSFRYNGKAGLPTDKVYVGVIAQDMQNILPASVGEFTYPGENGSVEKYLDFDATALTYILINSVKELKQENDMLKEELASIKDLLISNLNESGDGDVKLWQNVPNPYSGSSTIKYRIPKNTTNAAIKIYTSSGMEIKSFDISGNTIGEITLSSDMFSSGTYLYSLYVNGMRRESKKLILTP